LPMRKLDHPDPRGSCEPPPPQVSFSEKPRLFSTISTELSERRNRKEYPMTLMPPSGPKLLGELAVPELEIENLKWADMRGENLDKVAKHWADHPDSVRVFRDTKLRAAPLAMLRFDVLNDLVNALSDVLKGRAGLQVELSRLDLVKTSLTRFFEQSPRDDCDSEFLRSAIENIEISTQQFHSKLVFLSEQKLPEDAPLSPEELEIIQREGLEDDDL
jgi:hypothetical protein